MVIGEVTRKGFELGTAWTTLIVRAAKSTNLSSRSAGLSIRLPPSTIDTPQSAVIHQKWSSTSQLRVCKHAVILPAHQKRSRSDDKPNDGPVRHGVISTVFLPASPRRLWRTRKPDRLILTLAIGFAYRLGLLPPPGQLVPAR